MLLSLASNGNDIVRSNSVNIAMMIIAALEGLLVCHSAALSYCALRREGRAVTLRSKRVFAYSILRLLSSFELASARYQQLVIKTKQYQLGALTDMSHRFTVNNLFKIKHSLR